MTKGVIRFLSGQSEGATDFEQQEGGSWSKTSRGKSWSGFLKQQGGSSQKLHVFKDPFAFFEHTNGKGMMSYKSNDHVFLLNSDGHEALDLFLAQKPKIKDIDLFGFKTKELAPQKKLQLSKNGLSLNFHDSSTGAKSKNRGHDLSV